VTALAGRGSRGQSRAVGTDDMELQYTPYTLPLLGALLLAVVSTAVTWNRRDGSVETWSVALQLSVLLWVLSNLMMISTATREWIVRWYHLFFLSPGLVVVSMMAFTLHFTGRGEQLTRRRLGLLLTLPVGMFFASVTNRLHGLMLVDPTLDTSGSYAVLDVGFGPGVYGSFLVGYGVIAIYTALLALQVKRTRNVYRKLSFVLLAMVVAMSAAPIPTLVGVSPFPYWIFFAMTYLVVGVGTIVATTSITVARMIPVDRLIATLSPRSNSVVPLARDVIMQEVDNGVVVLDTEGRVVDINRTAKTMLGLDRPLGRLLSEITHEELTTGGEQLRSVVWGEKALQELHDQVWVETEGGEYCYDVRITKISDETEEAAGFAVLLHDITEQKEHERQLEQQHEELRTQKQQLEHQNERLDQFASIVSHDLRNPLNVAKGNVDIPLPGAEDEAETVEVEVDRLETIQSAHERMGDIIDDALTLAREGKAVTETEPVALEAVVEDAWSNVDTADATLERTGSVELEADRDRLLTVFENLVRNSLDHGKDGEQLTIRVGPLDGGRGFYLEDDGVGIPSDERETVFEHGYTTSSEGTGLGLSIVRDIVRGHGWSIAATESDDGGARFEVTDVSLRSREFRGPARATD